MQIVLGIFIVDMYTLDSFPADIIVDLLVLLPNLATLYSIIRASRQIHDVFTGRRCLVLGRVYENQLRSRCESLIKAKANDCRSNPDYWKRFAGGLQRLQRFCERPTLAAGDTLALRRSAWTTMRTFDVPIWYIITLGHNLMRFYAAKRKTKLAFDMASEIQQAIVNTEPAAVSSMGSIISHYEKEVEEFTKCLAKIYCGVEKPQLAMQLLSEYLRPRDFPPEHKLLLPLLKLLRENPGSTHENELMATLSRLYTSNRTGNPNGRQYVWPRSYFYVESFFHFVCLELNRFDEALPVLQKALHLITTDIADLTRVVAMARRMIKSLKQAGHRQQVLTVRKSVLERMESFGLARVDIGLYFAWAKEYAADARLLGSPDVAMKAEEHLLRTLGGLPSEEQIVTRCQNVARTLEAAYEEAHMTDKIRDLHQTYQQFIDGGYEKQHDIFRCQKFKADMSVPIVV